MQQKHIDMVRKFRIMMGLPYNDSPIEVPITWQHTHYDLIAEEIEEYSNAETKVDRIDALVDATIFCLGALDHAGVLKLNLPAPKSRFAKYILWQYLSVQYEYDYLYEHLDFWLFFEIVMQSNFSKACSSMEAAKAKQDEYEALWANNYDFESKCRIETINANGEQFIVLKRVYPSGTVKLLKGDQYWKPEPKLEEELKRQTS